MKPNYTHIALLIDRSGSMISIKDDMEGGLESFIQKQKALDGECTLSVVQFDDQYEKIINFKDIKEVDKIVIEPRGWTALIDAACKFINETGQTLNSLPESKRPEKVLFLIITDGYENSSREFKAEDLKEKIKHQEEKYKWEFVYLGANQDAFTVGSGYGISASKMSNFKGTKKSITTMFASVSDAAAVYRSATADAAFNFTAEQQKENEKE